MLIDSGVIQSPKAYFLQNPSDPFSLPKASWLKVTLNLCKKCVSGRAAKGVLGGF